MWTFQRVGIAVLANPREFYPWEADVLLRAAVRGMCAAADGLGFERLLQLAALHGGLRQLAALGGAVVVCVCAFHCWVANPGPAVSPGFCGPGAGAGGRV